MAKYCNPSVIDALLNTIKANAGTINVSLCSTQPTTRAEADATYMLGKTTMNKTTELTLANGDASGRKLTFSAKTGVAVTNTGTGQHVAIYDDSSLLYVTTCPSQAVSAAGTVDIGSWKIEVANPT